MSDAQIIARRNFLRGLDIGEAAAAPAFAVDGTDAQAPIFLSAQQQAVVVGSDIVSFTQPVEAEFREAITDSALVAQLAANARFDPRLDPIGWFDHYFAIMGGLGWTTQVRDTAEYRISRDGLQVHEAITEVVMAFLGPLPGAAALVKLTLDSLKAMDKDSPWITLFNQQSEHAEIGRFQFTLVRRGENGGFLADAMCFAIQADRKVTQILFFKLSKTKTRMRRSLATVSIGADALNGLRPQLKQKLVDFRSSFLLALPLKPA